MTIALMHTPVSRVVRGTVGVLLACAAVVQPFIGLGVFMVAFGVVLTVTAAADFCPLEHVLGVVRGE